jgi:hypothetical protein
MTETTDTEKTYEQDQFEYPRSTSDLETALQRIISELSPLTKEDRRRLVETVITFFALNVGATVRPSQPNATAPASSGHPINFQFSESDEPPSPKAFILTKSPKTDVERVACLAYYLARFRATTHMKTKDISAINTESAHRAFSNTAFAVENATKAGLLVPSIKGHKQISAMGEQFVDALPDREAAKEVLSRLRSKRVAKKETQRLKK